MKQKLKALIWLVSDCYLTIISKIYFNKRSCKSDTNRFVILTPSSVGNLGDEAMVSSIVTQIRKLDPSADITLITHSDEDSLAYEKMQVGIVCLKGFFSVLPKVASLRKLNSSLVSSNKFILLGADIIDGRYSVSRSYRRLMIARKAYEKENDIFVLGFSFSDRSMPRIRRYMRSYCSGFNYVCRDPRSADRIAHILSRDIPYGADLAFLLEIPKSPETPAAINAEKVLCEWRKSQRVIVAFNANPLGLLSAMPSAKLDQLASNYAAVLNTLIEKNNICFLCLTHDNRKAHSDREFMSKITDQIQRHENVHFVPETIRATDIKFLCKRVDLTVTGRMHMGIASLGAGTSTMVLDFQGKVKGLYELFGLQHMDYQVADVINPEVLVKKILKNVSVYEDTAKTIEGRLVEIRDMARLNVNVLGGFEGNVR